MQPHSKMLFQVLTLNCSSSANCTSKLLDATILNSCRRDYDMQKWIHDTGQDLCIFRFMFEIFEMYNIIVYSIYIYIHILYVEMFSFFCYHTSHTSQFSLFSLSRVCVADLRTQGFLSENCGFGGPLASEITAFGGMLSFWSNVSHTQFLVFNFDRYSCCGVARWHHGFVLRKKTCRKIQKNTTLDEDGQAF